MRKIVIAQIHVDGVTAIVSKLKKIPKGIVGATIVVTFADRWADMSKIAVFKGVVTKDVLITGNSITIPAECVEQYGYRLLLGFYGVDGDTIAIPTIWADLGTIQDATDPSGDTSTDPSLPVWAQLQQQINEIKLKPGPQGPQGDKGEKGDKGDSGDPGYTPVKGVDYFTPEEVQAIAEQAAGMVDVPECDGLTAEEVQAMIDDALEAVANGSY